MNIVNATPADINRWVHSRLDAGLGSPQLVISFGGDRAAVIRDGGGLFAKEGDEIIGVVSFSPTGECSRPSIIGLWANNVDIGVALMKSAIDALGNMRVNDTIVFDVCFHFEQNVCVALQLQEVYWSKLEVRNFGSQLMM